MVLLLLFVLATSGVAQAQSKPAATKPAPPAATKASAPPAPRKEPGKPSAALSLAKRRPIILDALRVEGKTDAPRVLFVHAGPTVALDDAPAHPSYLRDDFTAALSSPVRVRVRTEPLRSPTAGGNR
jgi:hypothetical protein